ncbi:MAG: class I mannose-6-phosphate isomerase [Verrucomicrobiota bacterium JB022]|nr:class I mannose-6-phosphate isomerase [Verrucomicrobiota bacterium JB022]
MNFLLFNPIYQERVWGSRRFETALGRNLPAGVIGESWEIVDRPEANSEVASGAFSGQTLRQLIEEQPQDIMGPGWKAEQPFPILVKWLDCAERLSLQVHPPASVADELKGEPKTENWYVVATEGDSAVLAGLNPGVTREQFEDALKKDELEPLVCRLKTEPGDALFVPSGRLHAIDGGNLILEIQQNSDTTYRVYDWGRVGLDGKPRQLHVEQSMRSIDFNDFSPTLTKPQGKVTKLVQAKEFHLDRIELDGGDNLAFAAGDEPRIISVVSGRLHDETSEMALNAGDNALLPYAGKFSFVAEESAVVLITHRFAGSAAQA